MKPDPLSCNAGTSDQLVRLQQCLFSRLAVEDNLKVLRQLLRALNTALVSLASSADKQTLRAQGERHCQDQDVPGLPASNDSQMPWIWTATQRLLFLAGSHDPTVKGRALCCLGSVIGFSWSSAASTAANEPPASLRTHSAQAVSLPGLHTRAEVIDAFLGLAVEAAKPGQHWQARAAAAEALQYSGELSSTQTVAA